MDQAAWLEEFGRRGMAQMEAEQARIAAKLNAQDVRRPLPGFFSRPVVAKDGHGEAKVVADVVVLGSSSDDGDLVAGVGVVRRVVASALAAGWSARTVRALAADPTKGLIESVTVRFSRHDERGFAAWWGGRFQCAWLLGPLGFERLGMRTTLKARSVADALDGVGRRSLDTSLGQ